MGILIELQNTKPQYAHELEPKLLKEGYIGDYIGDYYKGYLGGY